jgi:hypothetical protein
VLAALAGGIGLMGLSPAARANSSPVWKANIPDQNWKVGESVYLDLSKFVSDPDNDELIFSLSQALPPGVTIKGGIISGTPTNVMPATDFVVSAYDRAVPMAPLLQG